MEKRELLSVSSNGFVSQIYRALLQHDADPAGLAAWSSLLDQGQPRSTVVASIESTPEYRTDLVGGLYTRFLHRSADQAGLNALVVALGAGATVEQAESALTGSDEYFRKRGGGTNDGFLDALYHDALNRAVDPAARAAFDQALANGTTPGQVATIIFNSTEFRQDLVQGDYQLFLNRAADPGGLANLVAALGNGTTDQQLVADLVGSDEYYLTHVDARGTPSQLFVSQLYLDLLGRPVDPSGLSGWKGILDQGGSRTQVALHIESGAEYETVVVQGLYATLLHRSADPGAIGPFVAFLGAGNTVEQVQAVLAGSDEYFHSRGGGTNDGFLDALYHDALNRAVDPAGRAGFDQALNTGTTRTQVAAVIFASAEYEQDLVAALYQKFLHRAADPGGLSAFVSALQNGAHDEDVIADLVGSAEYFDRVTAKTSPPATPTFDLDPASDSPPLGDHQTTFAIVTLDGHTDPNVAVTLQPSGQTVSSDSIGKFQFTGVSLGLGPNNLTVIATDAVGNSSSATEGFTRLPAFQPITLTEGNNFLTQGSVSVDLGQSKGTRTISFQIVPQFDTTDQTAAIKDTFLVYLVDPSNPSQTILDRGQPGTALFALSTSGADYAPGLVRFDGQTVSIDVTSLANRTSGLLIFQLLNTDTDNGTIIQVNNLSDTVNTNGTAGPVFPETFTPALAGPALNLSSLSPTTNLKLEASRVRLDVTSGNYTADLQVKNNGPAISRQVAVLFPGLPSGVTLQNPSGKDGNGNPYVSFVNAIPQGGLANGTLSDPIEVTIADPTRARFSIVPQMLIGGVDAGPVFTPIGALSVTAGGRVVVPLHAADADGDRISFNLQSSGPLPTGSLHGNTLVLNPTPAEVGTYNLTVVASDGAQQAMQNVALTVAADPLTTTRISGLVESSSGQPLTGVTVDVAGVSTTTGGDGSFLLDLGSGPLPGTVLNVHGDQLSGSVTYPLVQAGLSTLLGHAVESGVNNVNAQPISLPAVDTADEVTIDPAHETPVTSPKLAGALLDIAAGTLKDNSGNLYSGRLGITEVLVNQPAAPVPDTLRPNLVVLVQPAGIVFSSPAPLTLPNRGGWKAGAAMDLWTLDPTSGGWTNAGAGQVSADGTLIQTTSGGVSAASLYFFAAHPAAVNDPNSNPRNLKIGVPAQTATIPFASQVDLHSGAVEETEKLVSYRSLGQEHALTLRYDSLWADPRPITNFGYNNISVDGNTLLVAKLAISRGTFQFQVPGFANAPQSGLSGGENFWSVPAGAANVEAALQADLSAQPTGVYTYTLESGLERFDGTSFTGTLSTSTGTIIQVSTRASPLGSGWSLQGLQQLVVNPDGSVVLVDGDGTALVFQPPLGPGQPYISPDGDFSKLVQNTDGTFSRTLKDQTVYKFNAQNLLASVTDRNGNQTAYQYDPAGRVTLITDPVGLQTTLAYTNNQVTITDPAGRVTLLQLDAAGNLVQITNPDQSKLSYAYDVNHLLVSATDALGNRSQDGYGFHGRVIKGIRKDGTVVRVAPVETACLLPVDQTADPTNPAQACIATAAQSFNADPTNVQSSTLDQLGQLVSQSDSLGALETVIRNAQNLPIRFVDGLGNPGFLHYDSHGNLVGIADLLSSPFAAGTDYPVPSIAPVASVVADVDGDGTPDIVTLTSGAPNSGISVLRGLADASGKPTGTFGPAVNYAIPFALNANLAVGDLNGDGHPDIVVVGQIWNRDFSNIQDGVAVLLNNGDGTFGAPIFYAMGKSTGPLNGYNTVVLGDFNGDGRLDVATTDTADNTVSVRLGDGSGGFGARTTFAVGQAPQGLAVGDLTGNGILDLVTVNYVDESISVLLGNKNPATGKGDGTFQRLTDISLGLPPGVGLESNGNPAFLSDLNGDTHLDIVADGTVLLGHGDGTFTLLHNNFIHADKAMALADLNGDGRLDIIEPMTDDVLGGYGYAVLKGNGDGTFTPTLPFDSFTTAVVGFLDSLPLCTTVADLNGNGHPDLVAGLVSSSSRLDVLLSTGGTGHSPLYTYDPTFNEPTSVTDGLGRQKVYAIDPANGNVLSTTVKGVGGDPDIVTSYTYAPHGSLATTTDPLHHVTANTYDALGRLVKITYADGLSKQYKYDAAGNQTAVIDENGHETDTAYDAMNRPLSVTDPLGNKIQYAYDAAGNLISETDARGNKTQYSYDAMGRRIKTIDALGGETDQAYDQNGNVISTTDPLGHTTQYQYDARNRLVTTIDANGAATRYTYDDNGDTTSITDAVGNTTQFAYDQRGRLIRLTDPLGKTIQYQYDGANNLIDKIDRDGREIQYQYDELNNAIQETWVGGSNIVHYHYDLAGNGTSTSDAFSSLTDSYNARNQLVGEDNSGTPGAPHVALGYGFDPAGNLLSVVDTVNGQSDAQTNYQYDAANRTIQVTQSGTGVTPERVNFTYTPTNTISTIDRFSDLAGTQLVVHSAYSYDALNRITGLTHTHGSTTLASYTYTFDAAGNVTQISDIDGTSTFGYDPTGQITSAAFTDGHNPNRSYSWDANGNPQGTGVVIGPDNRLSSDGSFSYQYDVEGNLILRTETANGKTRQFVWDYRNRLVSVADKDAGGTMAQQVDFTYDTLDRRISKRVREAGGSDVITYFAYEHDRVLLDFVDSDGPGPNPPTLAMRYLQGPGTDRELAQQDANGNVLWLLSDPLGSIRDLADQSGTVRNHLILDAFGKLIFQTNPAVKSRYLFAGREFDSETGLYFNRARYYDPRTGRFLSEDPLRFAGNDLNLYRYVRNNPLLGVDPSGLFNLLTGNVSYFGDQQLAKIRQLDSQAQNDYAIVSRTHGDGDQAAAAAKDVASLADQADTMVEGVQQVATVSGPDHDNAVADLPLIQYYAGDIHYYQLQIGYLVQAANPPRPLPMDNPVAGFLAAFGNTGRQGAAVEWVFLAGVGVLLGARVIEERRKRRRHLREHEALYPATDRED
jgi:RHS repeat-associated protein